MNRIQATIDQDSLSTKDQSFLNVDALTVSGLVEYLGESHRYFFNYHIPKIEEAFLKFIEEDSSQEAKLLFGVFVNFQVEFNQHVRTEEKEVFPMVVSFSEGSKEAPEEMFKTSLDNLLETIKSHHGNEVFLSELLRALRHLGRDHAPFSLRVLINRIQIFQGLLEEHAEIEDVILPEKLYVLAKNFNQRV